MNVQIIIVTYNGAYWIEKCLSSLQNLSTPVQVKIFDNASRDDTVAIIKRKFQDVSLIESDLNLGFGAANNILIQAAVAAQADYVFLLNQDAWIEPDTIENLIKISEQNPHFGILSPIHLNGNNDALDYKFSSYCAGAECPGFLSDLYLEKLKDVYQINFVNAAFWLMTKECLVSVGLFDPIFPHYGEDTDYVNRTQFHGLKVGIAPRLRGWHDRENRPVSKKQELAFNLISYIILLKNINLGFGSAMVSYHKVYIKTLFKYLLKGDFTSFFSQLGIGFKVFSLLGKILSARKICVLKSAYIV